MGTVEGRDVKLSKTPFSRESFKSINLRTFEPVASCRNLFGHSECKPSEVAKKLLTNKNFLLAAVGCIALNIC